MQRPGKILVVDDNPLNLKVLETLLAEYQLQTAESGSEALEFAPRFRPDVVLLDIIMPGIDGYETCRQMRANPALRHMKIIMVSARSELNERLAGYDVGADDYVTKPFDGDELLAKVRVYLKLKSVQEIEEVKNRTIEVLQHSNRTPLNNIISCAELLTCGCDLDEATREDAPRVILRHARRLHKLLEKGETLASMKSGQLEFEFARGSIGEAISRVVEELLPQCTERRVSIRESLPSTPDAVFDRQQMHFAIRALLENAIRFSKPEGIITVELVQRDTELVLTVTDQGEGIPAKLLPCLFEPFGNPESPLYNRGDGLSLAIVQQIAWAHDGDICVESEPGRGARFALHIPTASPAREMEAKGVDRRAACPAQ